jgi:hypothetical protein
MFGFLNGNAKPAPTVAEVASAKVTPAPAAESKKDEKRKYVRLPQWKW